MKKKENPEVDDTSSSTMFTSPGVIDEAGFVSMRLTLDESKNMETDRAKLQDTLEGMYGPKGINIHEDTLEKPKTDTTKGPNNVDSKGLNCQDCKTRVHINKQSPDIAEDVADGVHVHKGDFDDLVVQVPQAQIVEKTVQIPQTDRDRGDGERRARQASGSGTGYRREVLQESGELHRRAGVARLVVPIQGDDQNCQRSSIPLDGNG